MILNKDQIKQLYQRTARLYDIAGMELPQLYKQYKEQLHTSSDGQKFNVKGHSIHSTYLK